MKTQLFCCLALFLIHSGCIFTTQKPPEEVTVVAPVSAVSKIGPDDSAYLRITVQQMDYKVSLLKDSLITNDTLEIDKFISERQNQIDTNKILLASEQGANREKFIPVSRILKKYGYARFRMNTDNN